MKRTVELESAAEAVCNAAMRCPRIYQLPPSEGRRVLETTQNSPVFKYPAQIQSALVTTGRWGRIPVYIVKPEYVQNPVNVIFYIHGAGWVFGSFHTHEKLVRELAARTGCVVVFPEYERAPEAKYPIALEQCYGILCRVEELIYQAGSIMNTDTLTVAGDSVGGNMAAAMTLMVKYRNGPRIQKQLLYYPVTNACFNTRSYCEFAEGYYLYREGMEWFWNQYTSCIGERNEIFASPLRACTEELVGLPEAMIINGEADVLRDEGEAYASKLRKAGVPVTSARFGAIIHDFVMLNSLNETLACRGAMDLSKDWIVRKNDEVIKQERSDWTLI